MVNIFIILLAITAAPAYCQTAITSKTPATSPSTKSSAVNGTRLPLGFAAMHRCVDDTVKSASMKCAALSAQNRLESVGTRLNRSTETPRQQSGNDRKFCYARCIMDELKAVNPSGSIVSVALEPVIIKSSLNEDKKSAALTNLRSCLASNATMTGCPRRTTSKTSSNATTDVTTTTTMRPTITPIPSSDPICVGSQVAYSCIRAALSNAGCGPKCYSVTRSTTMPPWRDLV